MTSLAQIVGYARAGALDYAWSKFDEEGFAAQAGDPVILNLKGRLLKDLADRASGTERARLWGEAAAAYEAAAAVRSSSYSLINAATLRFLAGEPRKAAELALRTVAMIEGSPDEPETPYYRAATRAEALLLLDRDEEARAAFAEAVALAPRAWEDHASTLRQFERILSAQGRDSGWLELHRPARSLHFGGHMSFDARVVRRGHLDEKIAAVLDEERVGFGYGALAAGADIIIAEALLERGAELHAVLPGGAEAFAAVSVDPFGLNWRKRFDTALERAATVRAVAPLGTAPDRMMIGLGDEIAMGAAVMNARRLETRALQLLVLPDDEAPADGAPAHAHARWAEAGWRQRIVRAPRESLPHGRQPRLPVAPHERLAILAVAAGPSEGLKETLAELAARLRDAPPSRVPAYFTGGEVILAYVEAGDAARVATRLAAGGAGRIGGHYGIADPLEDPFSGGPRLAGEAAALAAAAAASAPPGSVCVTADFAAALAAAGESVQSELVGELEGRNGQPPVELFALKPRL